MTSSARRYRRRTPLTPTSPLPEVTTHGKWGYDRGCRCDTCRTAKRDRDRARRANRKARTLEGLTDVEHGTIRGYQMDGCRCEACSVAAATLRSVRKSANPEKVNGYQRGWNRDAVVESGACRYGYLWTGAELEIVTRTDLTVAELAVLLGRTQSAVVSARVRATTDPKWLAIQGVRQATRPAARVLDKRGSER